MKAARFTQPGAPLEVVDVPKPTPGKGEVLLRVQACGVCHTDAVVQVGGMPGIVYPRIPGHEVVGVVEELGADVPRWKVGDRAGIGYHGYQDGTCEMCRRGEMFACRQRRVTGISFDGGYAEFMVAPFEGLAAVPSELTPVEAAPMMCAGITTFNALRNSGARPGDVVAVLGLGGLGHLGVQYAAKMGFRAVAIARGPEKAGFAKQLGAAAYLDSLAQDCAAELSKLGGARVILSTATDVKGTADLVPGLSVNGQLLVVGIPREAVPVPIPVMVRGRASVRGWSSGVAVDSEEALRFGVLTGVRPITELFPLEKAPDAYDRMLRGAVRFRAVLTP